MPFNYLVTYSTLTSLGMIVSLQAQRDVSAFTALSSTCSWPTNYEKVLLSPCLLVNTAFLGLLEALTGF